MVIPGDPRKFNPAFFQHVIEKKSAAGTLLPIHKLHVPPRKIGHSLDILGITFRDHQPLFPLGKGDDFVSPARKQFLHNRYIRFAGLLVAKM